MRIFAVPRWVFGFWTWNFDTWFSSSSPRHSIVDFFFFFFSPHMAGRMFSLILKLGKSAPKCLFFFVSTFACLDEPELNHVSKVQFRTLKIERGTAILVKSWPLGRPSLYDIAPKLEVRRCVVYCLLLSFRYLMDIPITLRTNTRPINVFKMVHPIEVTCGESVKRV